MSTGVGGGLVLDGRLYRGTGGAGEVGHMPVEWGADSELCGCGRRGCLEAYVGGRRWTERLARITPAASRVAALAGAPAHARPEHVIAAAREGDAFARAELERWNRYLARGLIALSYVLAPEVFVLGTIATAAGEALCFEPLRRALAAAVWPSVARHIDIRGSALGEDRPLLRGAVRGARGVEAIAAAARISSSADRSRAPRSPRAAPTSRRARIASRARSSRRR